LTPPPTSLAAPDERAFQIHVHGVEAMASMTIRPARVGPVQIRIEPKGADLSPRDAFKRLLRFMRRLVGRARMRLLLQGRVERRFEPGESAEQNGTSGRRHHAYYYVQLAVGEKRPHEVRLPQRPRLLGALHELAAPDAWEAVWDVRFGADSASYFFNHRYHIVSWRQPEGTLLCGACSRVFAARYCGDCGTGLCSECVEGRHDGHRLLKVRGSVESAVADLWAAWHASGLGGQ
jgi:hypothetical protein